MTRPLDDRINDMVSELDEGIPTRDEVAALLRECRAALAAAREDGAREREAEIVAYLQSSLIDNDTYECGAAIAALDEAADSIASGKHRP